MKTSLTIVLLLAVFQVTACKDGGGSDFNNSANPITEVSAAEKAPATESIVNSNVESNPSPLNADLTFKHFYDSAHMAYATYEREECPVSLELRALADPDTTEGYFKPAVFIHGGGWVGRPNWQNKEHLVESVRYLLDRGHIVYYITYRVPSDTGALDLHITKNPEAYDCEQHWIEVNKDVSFAINNIANRNPSFPGTSLLDPEAKIFLSGASSGAQLAVYFAAHEPTYVQSVYPVVGTYDFDAMRESAYSDDDWIENNAGMISLLDAYLGGSFLEEDIGSEFLFENSLSNHYSNEWPKMYLVNALVDGIIPYESVNMFCQKASEISGQAIETVIENDDFQLKSCSPNIMLETRKKTGHLNSAIPREDLEGERGLALLSGEFPMPEQSTATH
ncbi:MAG: hypothetical protein ACR2PS_07425 [Pseudomonadales bacterium]